MFIADDPGRHLTTTSCVLSVGWLLEKGEDDNYKYFLSFMGTTFSSFGHFAVDKGVVPAFSNLYNILPCYIPSCKIGVSTINLSFQDIALDY